MQLDPYVFGVLSALAATVFFGATNIVYLRMSKDIGVMDIMFTRIWVSLPLAFVFAVGSLGSFDLTIPVDAMLPLAFSMVIGIMIGDGMYFLSQDRIGVSKAFPIAMSYPLLVYLLTALFLGEPVILQRIIGAVITVVGVGLIARAGQVENEGVAKWKQRDIQIGFVLAILTALCWALSDTVFQFGLVSVGAAESNFFRLVVASVILVPIFFISLKGGRKLPSQRTTGMALLTGLVGVGLSLIAYSYAVKFIGATVTAVIVAAAPVFTAPLSALYLGEDVNRRVILGTILTIIGVFLVVIIF
ncbi:MAG: DMT family transporter [Candidatus Thorarchaeota archaeon]|jgi:drug/metabolite transporter (DMT)-like permease